MASGAGSSTVGEGELTREPIDIEAGRSMLCRHCGATIIETLSDLWVDDDDEAFCERDGFQVHEPR